MEVTSLTLSIVIRLRNDAAALAETLPLIKGGLRPAMK